MKAANEGVECESSDVDFLVDCCSSSINGHQDSASVVSREELLPAFAAWKLNQLNTLESEDDGAGGTNTPIEEAHGGEEEEEEDDTADGDEDGYGEESAALARATPTTHHEKLEPGLKCVRPKMRGGRREEMVAPVAAPQTSTMCVMS